MNKFPKLETSEISQLPHESSWVTPVILCGVIATFAGGVILGINKFAEALEPSVPDLVGNASTDSRLDMRRTPETKIPPYHPPQPTKIPDCLPVISGVCE